MPGKAARRSENILLIHDREEPGLDEVCASVCAAGIRGVRALADISTPQACSGLIELTVRELGSIDILVNNAGIIWRTKGRQSPFVRER